MANDVDVMILGASFAGIEVMHQLVRYGEGQPPKTVVIDRKEVHHYLPLVQERLCQRLSDEASQLETAAYVRSLPGVTFVCDEVKSFDPQHKEVRLASGETWRARCVVVALGSAAAPPEGLPGAAQALTYKAGPSMAQAKAALDATLTAAPDSDRPAVVVVGGGISGVELAGELADLRRERPRGWAAPAVTLISSGPRLMPEMSPRVARRCRRSLTAQGVDVRLGGRVTAIGRDGVTVQERGDDETKVEIAAALVFWAAGIRPAPVLPRLGLPMTNDGWLQVGPTLQPFPDAGAGPAEIFACGDAVRIVGGHGRWDTMQRAIECIWQGKVVARNILRVLGRKGDDHPPLEPHRLRRDFFYGVSVGRDSWVVYKSRMVNVRGVNHAFRRWLMRRYFDRYTPLPKALPP